MKESNQYITPIIVVNWNGIEDTKECIESILLIDDTDYMIYLVDNGSEENQVLELVKLYQDHPKVSLHLNKSNIGFSKAHIKIYKEVLANHPCKYIALLNNDTIVEKNWLSELINFADSKNVDLTSSKMISYFDRSKIDNTGHKMLNTGEILPIGHGDQIEKHNKEIFNLGPCAGACLYSKKMIEEIGFFDSYFSTGYEDAEFGLRAIVAGYKSMYTPNAIVYHKMGQSVKKIFNFEYTTMIQTSILYSYFKNAPAFYIILNLPFLLLKNILLFLINILFLRKKYLMVQIKAWVFILNSARTISIKRKEVQALRKNEISSFQFFKLTSFFLFFDLKRFWNIFILRKPSALDTY